MENIGPKIFEKEGLKIDKERVLTYSHLGCPLDCKYCFIEDINFNQQTDVSYLSEKQFKLIETLPEEIKLIMLGCDTEFFQSWQDSLTILEKLTKFNKDISIITKLALNNSRIAKLNEIDKKLRQHNNFLSLSISITCLESSKDWEPKVPTPKKKN